MRTLDPEYNLVDGLLAKAPTALKAALEASPSALARVRFEAVQTAIHAPEAAAEWLGRLRREGLQVGVRLDGLRQLGEQVQRSSDRVALALVTLGLHIASSLLMQHSIGPRLGGVPVLAVAGYALALWFTLRLVRQIRRSGLD